MCVTGESLNPNTRAHDCCRTGFKGRLECPPGIIYQTHTYTHLACPLLPLAGYVGLALFVVKSGERQTDGLFIIFRFEVKCGFRS